VQVELHLGVAYIGRESHGTTPGGGDTVCNILSGSVSCCKNECYWGNDNFTERASNASVETQSSYT
jgi:hypothetical protein